MIANVRKANRKHTKFLDLVLKDAPYPCVVAGNLDDVACSKTTKLFRELSSTLAEVQLRPFPYHANSEL